MPSGGSSGHQHQPVKLCTGRETLTKYEQEGLVPFVGKDPKESQGLANKNLLLEAV